MDVQRTASPTVIAFRRVCAAANKTPDEVRSDGLAAALVRPRQVFCWLAHRKLGKSLGQIGVYLGRDHSTVLYAVRRVERALVNGDRRYTDIIAEAMKGDA